MNYAKSISTCIFKLEADSLQSDLLLSLATNVETNIRGKSRPQSKYSSDQFPYAILKVVDQPLERPFIIRSRRRALITTWNIKGFCFFAGMSQTAYLELACLLALTQLRALSLNPLIEQEDFLCDCFKFCPFTRRETFQEYAFVYEKRTICEGCRGFYVSLGVESELLALLSKMRSNIFNRNETRPFAEGIQKVDTETGKDRDL